MVYFTGFMVSLVGLCITAGAFWAAPSLPDPALTALIMLGGLGLACLGAKIVDQAGE